MIKFKNIKFCHILLILIILVGYSTSQAYSDLGLFFSQSPFSKSQKIKLGLGVSEKDKLNFFYSKTQLNADDYSDPNESSFKLNYRRKWTSELITVFDIKKSDNGYFFEGNSISAQVGFKVFTYESNHQDSMNDIEEDIVFSESFDTTIKIKIEQDQLKYSKINSESLKMNSFSISIDQDLPMGFSLGINSSVYRYESSSFNLQQALNQRTSLNTDINSYAQGLNKSSFGLGLDYTYHNLSIGLSGSLDRPLYSDYSNYRVIQYSCDYTFLDNYNAELSYTSSQSLEAGSTSSNTTSFGLSYIW